MRRVTAPALTLLALCAAVGRAQGDMPDFEGFIRVQNGRFTDANCREFPITGMNTWMLMEAAAGLAVIPCQLPHDPDAVHYTFRTAAESGFTTVRTFAHGVNDTLPLQIKPGVYNETAFEALDYILETAAMYGVRLILTMGDNWQYADAKRNYNAWAGFNASSDLFWTSNTTRGWYKAHMAKMVSRVNSRTGVRYGDDPTIMAWNLMNEPRCDCFPDALPYPAVFANLPAGCAPTCADTITAWVAEMAAYLKSADSNHLVTIGEEGFWGYWDANMQYNPETQVSPWAALTGNNFTDQHSQPGIDFATVHYWPDQWTPKATSDGAFFGGWMSQHQAAAAAIGKPLVLEELGKGAVSNSSAAVLQASVAGRRLPFMQMVYGGFNSSLQSGGNWRGTLFWMWGFCPDNTLDNDLQVAANDLDFQTVILPTAEAALEQAASASPVAGCEKVPVGNATVAGIPVAAAANSPQPLAAGPSRALPSTLPSVRPAASSSSSSSSGGSSIQALATAG